MLRSCTVVTATSPAPTCSPCPTSTAAATRRQSRRRSATCWCPSRRPLATWRCVPEPGRRLMGLRTRPAGGNTRDLWLGFGRVCSNLQVTGPVSCRPRQVKDSIRLFACPASTDASLAPASAVSAPGAGRALRPRRGSSSAASRRGAHGTRHDPRSAPPPRPAR